MSSTTTRALLALATLLLVVSAGHGCAPDSRYRVLSFFFDGVPPPEGTGTSAATSEPGEAALPPKAVISRHAPYAKKQCVACHSPMTNTLIAPVPGLCLGCHKMGLEQKRYVHAPSPAGFCTVCHNPHLSRHPFLLLAEPRQMCFYCHNPEDVARNRAHVDDQAPCTQCHNPHADNRYFLRSAPPELCLGCHKTMVKEKRYVHAPERGGFCGVCHDSHRSREPFLLLSEAPKLCYYCHSPKEVAANKAHQDDQAPCTQCHDPHADNRYFLRSAPEGTPPPVEGEPAPVP